MKADLPDIEPFLAEDEELHSAFSKLFCKDGTRVHWLFRENDLHKCGTVLKAGAPTAIFVSQNEETGSSSKIAMAVFSIFFAYKCNDDWQIRNKGTQEKTAFVRSGKRKVYLALVESKNWLLEFATFKSKQPIDIEAYLILNVPNTFKEYLSSSERYRFAESMADDYWERLFNQATNRN